MRQELSKRICSRLVWVVVLVALGVGASPASSALGARGVVDSVAASDAVVSGTFVGKADGALVGVAVIARKPAAEGQARAISVYVCNGTSLAVWLTGMTAGNEAELRSADGRVGVNVVLAAQAASGKVGVSGGSGFRFTVPRAVGIAGLFDVTVAADGAVRGASPTGARLTGRVGFGGKLLSYAPVVATARAGGQEVRLTAFARRARPGAYRWIVLPDRTVYGANRKGPRLGGVGAQLIRPTGGKKVRLEAGSAGQPGYDDKECQRLANQYNQLAAIFSNATNNGNGATAASALSAATATAAEMDDHCVVIE